jgi:ATP-dependent protease ClpP protease subunit
VDSISTHDIALLQAFLKKLYRNGKKESRDASVEVGALDDGEFTPNPDRAIWLAGEINEALENRLRPKILELTSCNRKPITVFIDSDGGSPAVGQRILELLRSTNQEGASPCRIITVALSQARSIAADILSAGDFAIADPGSKLLYHGTRIPVPQAVTADYASLLTEVLRTSNRRFAASLLNKAADRFIFLIAGLRATFEAHRASANDQTLTDVDCFRETLCQGAPPAAQRVLRQSAALWSRHYGLVAHFQKKIAKIRLSNKTVNIEKIMLDASVTFEYENNEADRDWSLRAGGLSRINEHFFFLAECFHHTNCGRFAALRERWEPFIALTDNRDALSAEDEAGKFESFFLPFWSFFVALYHTLQQTENELTALDAFWLGLIDTVGRNCPRPDS